MKKKMQFTFSLMNEEEARTVFAWHYDAPYAVYDMSNDDTASVAGFLDRRSPYYAVRDEQGELVGYFGFGTAGMVGGYDEPALYVEDGLLTIGCGMRPDLTGRGMGLVFVNAGLEFARQTFAPERFHLFVYSWNERAIRVYERAGFRRTGVFIQPEANVGGKFVEMERDA